MSKDRQVFSRCLFLAVLFAISIVGMIAYNMYTSDRPQVFTDVIKEFTAIQGSNKTAERNLYYIFSMGGVLLYGLFCVFTDKRGYVRKADRICEYDLNMPVIAICTLVCVSQLLFDQPDPLTITAAALCLILLAADRALLIEGLGFWFMCVYGACGLYRLYVFCGGGMNLSRTHIAAFAFFAALILIPVTRRFRNAFARAVMVIQVIIPLVLLIFEASGYSYGGEDLNIPVPFRVKLFIRIIILLMIAEALVIFYKNRKAAQLRMGDVISYGSCISIMAFNSYIGSGVIVMPDYHHPFENVIGFTEVFEFGRKAFDQYIPISGAYSLINGAILSLFGKGKAAYYNVTENIFFLGIAVLTVFILMKTFKSREWVLFSVLMIKVINYNRIVLILPIILLLTYPVLIKRKNLWLKAWFLSSLIHGLYYPLFGAAVCLGFLPLAIYELVSYLRSDDFANDRKKISFYVWWIICILPAVFCIPWLLGTYEHIRTMSAQTIFADGMTRFSQKIAGSVLPYVENMPVRMVVHYIISYLFPISLVWIFTAVAIYIGGVKKAGRGFEVKDPAALCIGLSGGIILFISFSYTAVRMDIGSLYGRNHGVIFALAVLMIVIVDRYVRDTGIRRMIIVYTLVIVSIMGCAYTGIDSLQKLESKYPVPDGFEYIDGSGSRFGESFKYSYEYVDEKLKKVAELDKSKSYFALGDFGYYYLYDLKGDGPMEAVTVKGYDAAVEAIDILKKNDTYIGTEIDPIGNYYLYNWLLTSGDYVWDEEKGLFVPNKEGLPLKEVHNKNKANTIYGESPMLLGTAGSWGSSMDSLEPIFKDVEASYETEPGKEGLDIVFDKALYGNDADFLYLDIENDMNYDYEIFDTAYGIPQGSANSLLCRFVMKKVYNPGENMTVSWTDDNGGEHDMSCVLFRGKLLIPLGGGSGWLLNDHDRISLKMADDEGNTLEIPGLENVRFLKLRDIR